jgi:RNA polymerase sigma-70 factor (ECF subfamily)
VNQYFRHRQKHRRVFAPAADAAEAFYHQLSEDRTVLEAELLQHVRFLQVLEQLKGLPIRYQEVISLRYFEGKSNKEIAEILGAGEGTIKSLLSRALEKLREKCYGKTKIRGGTDPDEQAGDTRA